MSTTTAGPQAHEILTVALDPPHLPHVAEHFLTRLGVEFEEHQNPSDRADVEQVLSVIATQSAKLDQIGWGEAEHGVTLTLRRDELEQLAHDLVESGSSMVRDGIVPEGMTYSESRRVFAHELEAGLAILEQLEASR